MNKPYSGWFYFISEVLARFLWRIWLGACLYVAVKFIQSSHDIEGILGGLIFVIVAKDIVKGEKNFGLIEMGIEKAEKSKNAQRSH